MIYRVQDLYLKELAEGEWENDTSRSDWYGKPALFRYNTVASQGKRVE